jgi:isoprenylcysteine carboxyl methyltransferase (ICMT) family protein YpbQ
MNFADFVTGTASVSIFTDVLALILPTWIVYELQMQWNQKLMLIGILSFGLL